MLCSGMWCPTLHIHRWAIIHIKLETHEKQLYSVKIGKDLEYFKMTLDNCTKY